MSAVKLKNAVLRALKAQIGREIPAGVVITGRLLQNRIWVDIDEAPFDVLKPEQFIAHGYQLTMGSDKDTNHTPEGIALLEKVKTIAGQICPRGVVVHFTGNAYMSQGRRNGRFLFQAS